MENSHNYTTMENSYPNPFNTHVYDPRREYDISLQDRISDTSNIRNFMNDNSSYPTEVNVQPYSHLLKTSSMPQAPFGVLKTPQRPTAPFGGLKPAKQDKISDILGSKTNYSKYNTSNLINDQGADRMRSAIENGWSESPVYSNPNVFQQPNGNGVYGSENPVNTPKLKVIDALYDEPNSGGVKLYSDIEKKQMVKMAINDYYKDFIMTKTAVYGEFSVYKAIVHCLICTGHRYIVAITRNDFNPLSSKVPLQSLDWSSFQARYTEDEEDLYKYGVSSFSYKRPEKTILNDDIRLVRKTQKSNIYQSDNLPLQIEILIEKEDDLSEKGSITSAIELYSTILTFLD